MMHFRREDADAWLERNREKLGQRDPVTDLIMSTSVRPQHVLEIGCSNGWRLAKLRESLGCRVAGIEPSLNAIHEARRVGLQDVHIGTADSLPFANGAFDMVIYGWCLYLAEPADHFRIVAEGDRVLRDGGHLTIHDFSDEGAFRRAYAHRDGLWSYHMNFPALWAVHPSYSVVRRLQAGDETVTMLCKNAASAFPVRA